VLDHTRHPVAAVAVSYPAADVDEAQHDLLVTETSRTAELVGRRLGG
jgi:DNA-binding IclR family transcriptional regulator